MAFATCVHFQAQRKEAYKHRRDRLEHVHAEQVRADRWIVTAFMYNHLQDAKFIASKRSAGEKIKESLQRSHEEHLARLDRQFLNELHELRRHCESALWEQERHQMSERFNLRRQQLTVGVAGECRQYGERLLVGQLRVATQPDGVP